ncbi:helix-turn-helix transcriptional regulator [Clostridium sp. 'deep sea']|nr:helix-turn-helix transcriptional regulator [Clostridium sp. 'deep sea']QOR36903.1 helix-turn-helix transcriptional regulator [Clostridium sp. 'deep sea']
MELSDRQKTIISIVKRNGPIKGEDIADNLDLSRAALRADLAILTMTGYLEARPRVGYMYSGKTVNSLIADRVKQTKVGEIKSVPVVVNSNQSIYDAVVTIFLEDVGTLFVINNDGFLEGVVSRKDLLKSMLGNSNLDKIPISIIMTRMPNVHVTTETESVWEAARKITEYEIDSLPVIREVENDLYKSYKVIGRISKTTITKLFVELGCR